MHPITGQKPDYHWQNNAGDHEPRWKNPYRSAPDPKDWWYTLQEVAAVTRFSRVHVYNLVRSGRIKGSQPRGGKGGGWRIQGKDIEEFMKGQGKLAYVPEVK